MGKRRFLKRKRQRTHAPLAEQNICEAKVAKTSPVEFVKQVQTETKKVVWPTRRETIMTGVMVIIMTSFLGLFFMGVDSFFDVVVRFLLSLAQ